MTQLTWLTLAAAAFVGTHLLMSHPWRAPMVARLGAAGFQGVYSLVSLATFMWMVFAARAMPPGPLIWTAPDWLWWIGAAIMLAASILLAGSLIGNPALPSPGAEKLAAREPRGVFAITRHPMMWSFALWGVVHAAIWPTPSNFIIVAAVVVLALGGSAGQDLKKARLMGAEWRGWVSRTAFVPFTGPAPAAAMWPGWAVLLGGVALWLVATWAHGWLGVPAVGVWR